MSSRLRYYLRAGTCALPMSFALAAYAQIEDNDGIYVLPAFEVSASSSPDEWVASEAVSGTRTASSIIDLPFSVQVLNQEFLDSFQMKDLDEFGLFISSFSPGEVESGGGGGSKLRGFTPPTFRNGFPRTGVGEVVNIGRVEVIKGPMSALYGRAEPGGIVNYVTKRPEAKAKYSLLTSVGNYDYMRTEAHATGPIVDGKLFYRVDASYTETGAEMEFYHQDTMAVSTSLMYKFGDNSALTVDLEYMDRKSNNGATVLGKQANTPVTRTDGSVVNANLILGTYEPLVDFNIWGPYAEADREITTVNVQFEHRFDDVWSFRLNGQYWERTLDDERWTTPQYQINTGLFNAREPYLRLVPEEAVGFQGDLLAHFFTGNIEHKFLVTADYSDSSIEDKDYRYSTADKAALAYETRYIDPDNPVWVRTERDKFVVQSKGESTDTRIMGTFVSERMSLFNGRVILLLGGRYDQVDVNYSNRLNTNATLDETVEKFTYMTGLTWRLLNDKLVAFVNSSSSFNGVPIIDSGTGEFLGFSEGTGFEFGVKGLALDGDFSYTVSLYQIDRDEADTNPSYVSGNTDGEPQYLGKRKERARGIELDTYWKATKNLTLYGSIGFADSEVVSAPGEEGYTEAQKLIYRSVVGESLTRVPDMNFGYALRYNLPIKGLSCGASVSYTDKRIVDYGNRITTRQRQVNDAYTLTNAYLAYWFDMGGMRHSLRLNLLNLFDEQYYTATGRLGKGIEGRLSYKLSF